MAQVIKQTPIINSQEHDLLCWKLTPNGQCHAKTAYYACMQGLYDAGEDRPRQPSPTTLELLNQVWKNKNIIPRIQTFAWRFLRRALPTGVRAGRFSKHISKLCCRCGSEEDDIHLFFTCPFVKAAWFIEPWFIHIDTLVQNSSSLTQIILNLMNMNHPHASLPNILNFMWCTWKARNDMLFVRREGEPYQISIHARALTNNLELLPTDMKLQGNTVKSECNQEVIPPQGNTITTDRIFPGTVIFADASCKYSKIPGSAGLQATGIGVFIRNETTGSRCSVMIQAATSLASSVFQAEAKALLLASEIAHHLNVDMPTFLTDNKTLARVTASN